MKYPFEASLEELRADLDAYVGVVFSCLESEFMVIPKGRGFIEYPVFARAYEALKQATNGFISLHPDVILEKIQEVPLALIVLRTILGFTPPEWAYITSQRTGIEISQGFSRALDRRIRIAPLKPIRFSPLMQKRVIAMLETACHLLREGAPQVEGDKIHRLDKADTSSGLAGIRNLAGMGVPYAMLLYERFLGRPFAGHRDSVSELIGNVLENAIEEILAGAGISYRKTKRAEKIPGFDQAPDFIIPDEFNPRVVIEAKITEDDGTARDKVTRVQHLGELSAERQVNGKPGFEVIACIAGRGFGVRKEDMKKLLMATRGKVFTLKTLDRLLECTRLQEFGTK
ncbi:hypothetical protein MTCOM_23030 [Moorella thermoacetica]|uniref:hypothetical protein n=1 Tax=Neomoorella thermoacetica TaxID=1525 RepID=UPI0030D267AC